MAKPKGLLEQLALVFVLIFLAALGFIFTYGSLFMLFFVPVATFYLWRTYDRTKELEARLSQLEKPHEAQTSKE